MTSLATSAQEDLLRAALQDGEPALAAFRSWRAAVDPAALDDGSYRLLPLLARNLTRLGAKDPLLDVWKGAHRRAFVRNELLFHDVGRVLRALAAAGVSALVIKGAALVATAYRESGLRPMADFDLLVPPEQAPRAFAALRSIGWRSLARRPERLVGPRHGSPFAGPSGREVDLHWFLLWENCWAGADDAVWAAAQDARLGALAVRAPCAADQLLHACVHGLQWSASPPIRWAADAFILAGSGAVDWERLVEETARRRLALPVRTALRWARDRIQAPIPEATLARLEALPVSPAERAELDAKLRRMVGVDSLRVMWGHHARASRAQGRGAAETIARFAPYLQHNWGVEHLAQLPYFMVYRGLRRIWIDAGFGHAPGPDAGAKPKSKSTPTPTPRPKTSTKETT